MAKVYNNRLFPIITVSDLNETRTLFHEKRDWIYRGQEDARWPLTSTLERFGGATRMIDVTRSFYVAAFFALENLGEGNKAAIWAMNVRILRDHMIGKKI